MIKKYRTKYDIVICDRCVFDPIAYSAVCNLKETSELLYDFLKTWGKTYDKIILLDGLNHDYLYEDGIRTINKQFKLDVDIQFKKIYQRLNAEGYLKEFEIR